MLSCYLALASRDRDVVGVDVDAGKIEIGKRVAEAARARGAHVSIDQVVVGELPAGEWDCIAIVDVLYLLPENSQARLIADVATRLRPNGVLVVKEMATTPAWKLAFARAQEFAAVRVLHITQGEELVFLPPRALVDWMSDRGLVVETRRLDRGRPHPHHLVVGRRPG